MKKKVKIMIFGTFDGLHKGHLNLFKQAKNLSVNSFVIASIARDKNVLRIKKKNPLYSERERKKMVANSGFVDKVVLGSIDDYIGHILKYKPDIIALGYDQKAYVKNLKKFLLEHNFNPVIKRLKSYQPHIYKNSLLRNKRPL